MSNENTQRLGLNGSQDFFPGKKYRPSAENGDSEIESISRAFASVLGQDTEFAAVTELRRRTKLDPDIRQDFEDSYKTLFAELYPKVRSVVMPDGKALAHRTVLPIYLGVFESQFNQVQKLAAYADYVYNRDQQGVLEKVMQPADSANGNEIKRWEIKYFLDTLLIMSRLALNGIGENFNNFGQVLPDIPLRDIENGNVEVTQLDAAFIPKKIKISGSESADEREQLFRSLAQKNPNIHPLIPPVADTFKLVEFKTLFRPRWALGPLPKEIPLFLMQEVTERMGKACVYAHIGLRPQAIIYIRLRSLGPNAIHIVYPNHTFYSKWQSDIDNRLNAYGATPDINDPQQKALFTMYHFLGYIVQSFEEKEAGRITGSPRGVLKNEVAKQRKLRNFKVKASTKDLNQDKVKPKRKIKKKQEDTQTSF